jgi:hypothetical protein
MPAENGRPDNAPGSVCRAAQEKEDQEMSGIVQKRETAFSNPSVAFDPSFLALVYSHVLDA